MDLDSLNFTLFYLHSTLAMATKTPEIELSKEEARSLAQSALNVMQHYNIKASQKAIDWGNLLMTGGMIYGAKFYAIAERNKKEAAAKREGAEASARDFNLA